MIKVTMPCHAADRQLKKEKTQDPWLDFVRGDMRAKCLTRVDTSGREKLRRLSRTADSRQQGENLEVQLKQTPR